MIKIDIIITILLSYFNYKNAKAKGYSGGPYVFMTIGLIVGLEILFLVVGLLLTNYELISSVLIAFLGVIIGGVSSFQIVKRLKPRQGFNPPYIPPFPGQNYQGGQGYPYQNYQNNQGFQGQNSQGNQGFPAQQQFGQPWPSQPFQQYVPVYNKHEGSGACDVCGRDVGPGEAYLVPVDIFYSSPKYKDWLIQNPVTAPGVQSLGGPDKYLSYMRTKDQTTHSAVCESCIHLFR